MSDLSQAKSVLRMDSLYFEDISFKRVALPHDENGTRLDFEVTGPITDGEKFTMILKLQVFGEDKYKLDVTLHGDFSVPEGCADEIERLKTNAVAIMFPFLRSEITLLTSQPDVAPIVLPPININAVMQQRNQD